jgi:hypothetical protein
MPVESEADLAVFFNVDEFGVAAVYSPLGGGSSTPCTLLMGTQDRTVAASLGRSILQSIEASVRKAELAAPARGGTFVVDGKTLTIQGDPRTDDAERRIWTFALT